MRYELINNFHNTKTTTKYSAEERQEIDYRVYTGTAAAAEKQARRRARNALCPSIDCQCCNDWGERK
ncbi:MAG: hypothetical protein SVY53_12065 [Chloroflexota bacterium]|nr:hypothetical protein [Chloroflexota bacterium]